MNATANSQLLLQELMNVAEAEFNSERRTDVRLPFCRVVSIEIAGEMHRGFIREISLSSVGLLHDGPLPLGEAEVTVSGQREGFRVAIVRCQPCGEGWYLSGGTVVDEA